MRDLTLNEVEEVNGGNNNLSTAEAYFDWASYYRIYYQTRRELRYQNRFDTYNNYLAQYQKTINQSINVGKKTNIDNKAAIVTRPLARNSKASLINYQSNLTQK